MIELGMSIDGLMRKYKLVEEEGVGNSILKTTNDRHQL